MNKDNEEQTTSGGSNESLALNLQEKGPKDSDVGTVFVDRDYRIKYFVSTIAELMEMNSFKVDYEFKDFALQFRYDDIKDDINYVIENQEIVKKEITTKGDNSCYIMEMRPYRTEKDVKGAVINFVDITELKEAHKELAGKVEKIQELQRQILNNDVSDRWRMGQYLHDDIGQSLVAAEFRLKHLRNRLSSGEDKEIEDDIDEIIDIVGHSMDGVRDLSHEIVPLDIEKRGIAHAFKNLAQQLEKRHDLNCEVGYDQTVDNLKDIEIATHLYRIIHEAVKNAEVHGDAENIKISVQSDDQYLYLSIADDGVGFSDDGKKESGMGINIMNHRMELIGGTLKIENTSEIGADGTTISCKIPVEKIKNSRQMA